MVPHLTTALSGPILELEQRFLNDDTLIEQWLRSQRAFAAKLGDALTPQA